MIPARLRFESDAGTRAALRAAAWLGALVFVVGLFAAPARVWAGYLIAFNYLVGLGLAGALFVAIVYLCSARWGTPMRRVPEAMTSVLPAAALLGVVLLFGVHSLYEWSHASVVETDPVLRAKSGWLNPTFFAVRLLLCFGLWIRVTRVLVDRSRRQDADGDPAHYKRNVRTSAFFMVVLTVTYSIASFDWLMSLEPHWFSTIFALYQLAGTGLSGLGAATILVVLLRRSGPLRPYVTDDHLQILGRLLMSLSLFWVYIWYSQYMLIWYAHLPEETTYYAARAQAPWSVLTPALLAVNWLVPFLVLLPRAACRSEKVLLRVAGLVMVGRVLDLFLQVGSPVMGDAPSFGIWEIGPVLGAIAWFFWLTLRGLEEAALVPHRDPTFPGASPAASH